MTNKQKKQFLILFCMMLGVLSIYFIVDMIKMDKDSQKEDSDKEIIEVFAIDDINEIEKLSYLVDGEKVELSRGDDGKWKSSDLDVELDSQNINQELLTQLKYVVAEDVVEEYDNLSEFGFDDPINLIDIVLKDGTEHKFVIGAKNEFSNSIYYLMFDNDTKIYIIDSVLTETFKKKANELEKSTDAAE